MATNITQRSTPQYWASSSDDVEYTFDFKNISIINQVDNGGKLQIELASAPVVAINAGDYFYIKTFYYSGKIFKVLSVDSTTEFTLDVSYLYIGTSTGDYIKALKVPTFDLYKGFKVGEDFPSQLPYTKVVSINSDYSIDTLGVPYISINVKSIVVDMFTVTPNFTSGEPDYDLFNAIRLEFDGVSTVFSVDHDYTNVLYCGLTNTELLETYSQNFHYLTPTTKLLLFQNSKTFGTTFWYTTGLISCPTTFKV